MKNDNLPGLSSLWLMSLAMALGILISVLVPLIISSNTVNSTAWIGFCGSILGGAITLIGLIVATRNVNRQLQVNLLIREETRMEEELPGLKQAFEFLDYCRSEFLPDPDHIIHALQRRGIEADDPMDGPMSLDVFAKHFSTTDRRTLISVFELVEKIVSRCYSFSRAEVQLQTLQNEMVNDIGVFPPDIIEERKKWRSAQQGDLAQQFEILRGYLAELDKAASDLSERMKDTNRKLIAYRTEIKKYLPE
jgi:hypothetical protein